MLERTWSSKNGQCVAERHTKQSDGIADELSDEDLLEQFLNGEESESQEAFRVSGRARTGRWCWVFVAMC